MGRGQSQLADELAGVDISATLEDNKKRVIAIDFDSTAWPFHTSFGAHPETPLLDGQRLTSENWASWDTPVEMLMSRFQKEGGEADMHALYHELGRIMDEARNLECITRHGLFPGFLDAVRELQAEGWEVVMITDNTDEGIGFVSTYLSSQGLDLPVHLAKAGQPKISWCQENDVIMLIDDAPKTILAAGQAGLAIATLRYLYNSQAASQAGAITASSWAELLPKIKSALSRLALVA